MHFCLVKSALYYRQTFSCSITLAYINESTIAKDSEERVYVTLTCEVKAGAYMTAGAAHTMRIPANKMGRVVTHPKNYSNKK